ncbi:IPT/TIG domain-containing protein [Terriglobus roseus]|uniref:IPT/TIG domain-containing protein n=1 Tax=Terriglobus roseus TaxID=392734 RepID=A0A1G7R2M6_9BACT|nr:IPT/TIG domain-containing protein [Terriglobus roseus]SDG05012.1 IPT/TIG domain-containing protein [Terriglobus roseus]
MKRATLFLLFFCASVLQAANPRWVAGSQWTNSGKAMNWYRNDVQYFVDAGSLSSSVSHAAAVSMVDAAASVWNLSALPFTLKNGGALAEDVSSANVYMGSSGLVWPTDVSSSNYTSKQIAVVLDADGSITDALLGSGASEPSNCRTNGVTEFVDLFIQPGKIAHARIVVNGRCSGAAAEQQLQLQYQLMRVFGRVLGIGWSQLNDNVFTAVPAPTYAQQMHWPIMHPIDIICGAYTYQCLPQPFTLREDDIAAMWLLYADSTTSLAASNMINMSGNIYSSGVRPLSGINLTVTRYQRWGSYGVDGFQSVSNVTGFNMSFQRGNPVTGPSVDTQGIYGPIVGDTASTFNFAAIPLSTGTYVTLASEPVNPLYKGAYAVGPYQMGSPSPSGSAISISNGPYSPGANVFVSYTVPDAASDCSTAKDGTESVPGSIPLDGTWSSRLCGVGHSSWTALSVKTGRTATVEVTATDETGNATSNKAMPLIGMWHGSDATGILPGLAAQTAAFNGMRTGMSQLRVSFSATESVRLAITDARGDGRADYTYRARVLYADSISPARVPLSGGTIAITGMGFAAGNTVTIGGVAARVVSISPTSISVVAPAMGSGVKDVVITDLSTGGFSTMTGAITYGGAASDVLAITSQPSASVVVGTPTPFALQLKDANGAAVRNGQIAVSASAGSIVVGACNLARCTLVTDASGVAQTYITPSVAGAMTVRAVSPAGSTVQASFTAMTVSRAVTLLRPTEYVAAGSGAAFAPVVDVTQNGAAAPGTPVSWTASTSRAGLSSSVSAADAGGLSSIDAIGALRDGEAATVQACAWSTVCSTQNVIGVAAANLRAAVVSGDAQSRSASDSLSNVALRVLDTSGNPVAGAAVAVYQAVSGWQPACTSGRCPTAPVYGTITSNAVSDDDGMVTVSPLQYANTAAVTKITASVGTQGAITITLLKTP